MFSLINLLINRSFYFYKASLHCSCSLIYRSTSPNLKEKKPNTLGLPLINWHMEFSRCQHHLFCPNNIWVDMLLGKKETLPQCLSKRLLFNYRGYRTGQFPSGAVSSRCELPWWLLWLPPSQLSFQYCSCKQRSSSGKTLDIKSHLATRWLASPEGQKINTLFPEKRWSPTLEVNGGEIQYLF